MSLTLWQEQKDGRQKENFDVRKFFEENKAMLIESSDEIDATQIDKIKAQYPTKTSLELAINNSEPGSDNEKHYRKN